MPFASDVLTLESCGPVTTLFLDRPAARNAMGQAFWDDLPRAMDTVGDEDEVRAIVIAARGPHFSAGLDLADAMGGILAGDGNDGNGTGGGTKASPARRAEQTRRTILRLQASINSVAECPKPVIAAVHGACVGGGVDLIAACDIRLAAADARFSVRETKMAIVADLGSLQRLPGIIGAGHVAELAFTGRDIDAERAWRIGLVNDVVDGGATEVLAAAQELAGEIAANSPVAVQGTKAVLRAGDGRSVADGLAYVAAWNAGMLASHDLTEAMAAFMEKRAPDFTGR